MSFSVHNMGWLLIFTTSGMTNVDCLPFQLRELMKERAVVLLPSHRSYLDFILVTFIMFNFNMKLPCIAAGQGASCHTEKKVLFNKY